MYAQQVTMSQPFPGSPVSPCPLEGEADDRVPCQGPNKDEAPTVSGGVRYVVPAGGLLQLLLGRLTRRTRYCARDV